MKKIIIFTLIVFAFALSAHAENPDVLDSSVYYAEALFENADGDVIHTIEPGTIKSKYSVINSSASKEGYSVICGLYSDGVLSRVSSQSAELEALGSKMFEFELNVPSDDVNHEIRAFLVRNLKVRTPLRSLLSLSSKSNAAYVTGFSFGEYEGKVNHSANLITVNVPKGTDLAGAEPEVTLSSGASCELSGTEWDTGETVEVTAENGAKKKYMVEIIYGAKRNLFDFEDYATGKTPVEIDKTIWNMGDNEDDYNTRVAEENGNKILVLYDDSLTVKTNGKTQNVLGCSVPFRLTMKVKYELPEGVSKRTAEDDYSYSPFYVRNGGSSSMCGIQPVYKNNKFWFHYMENGSSSKASTVEAVPGEWYDIEMYYYLADDGKYYTDYTYTTSSGNSTKISGIPSGLDFTEATTLYFSTSDKRRCVISYDDICLEELKGEAVNYSDSFDSSTESAINGGEIAYCQAFDSDALMISGTAEYEENILLPFEAGFRFSADSLTDGMNIVLFETDSSDFALKYKDDALCYSSDGVEVPIGSAGVEIGEACDIELNCVYDEIYENKRLDLYVNGALKANIPLAEDLNSISKIKFVSNEDTMYIDDFYVRN